MKRERVHKIVLLSLVLLISAIFLQMIHQFLMPMFMAGLFSAMAMPGHRWLAQRFGERENLASVLIILGMVVLVLAPLSMLIGVVVAQAINVGQSVTPWVQSFIQEPSTITLYLEKIPYYQEILPYRDVIIQKAGELVGTLSTFLIDSLSSATKMTMNALFGSVIMLYVMFYFMTMGEVLLERILYFLPLTDDDERMLLYRFTSVTRATIKGTIVIGIMQGTICGLAFAIAGIKGPVFWGSVMAVTSIIPAFGTAIVWGPALIILLLMGDFSEAIILGVLCGAVVGNLDNLVRPRLVGKDTEMHDLFVLFGSLGGISMFGLLGIIIGPIIAALFITIWEIYGKVFQEYLPDVGLILRSGRIPKECEAQPAEEKPQSTKEPQNPS
ncbi:AI-2E family transporter [Desulfopila aestuarii]|uniref:Predicted PurR-regulated permease PerM n=1 Tax=Desulfopila aestuarii DSM 18488 TaxID=1121416 RepID=A0A1M7XVY1_9BACT|nr:AI-2E family transporter [Desulfopila aestuarii]SHO42826.1 Predicted PurR-regulated permease PerM [Desulfopila aestuarii DSM 18488]